MNKDKEKLIKLVNQFVDLANTIDFECDDDDNEINDQLNDIAIKMEEATIPVFGHKVMMDFGTINAVFQQTDAIIKEIELA